MANDVFDDTLEQVAGSPAPTAPETPAVVPAAPAPAAVAPSAAAPANPYDRYFDQLVGAQQLRSSVTQSQEASPDRAAKVKRLSDVTGLAADLVDRNLDEIERRATNAALPVAQMVQDTPTTAAFLGQPQQAAVAKDDHAALGALEWIVKAPFRAAAEQASEARYSQLRFASMFRPLTQAETDLMGSYKNQVDQDAKLHAGDSWFKSAVSGNLKSLMFLATPIPYAAAGAAMGAVTGPGGAVAGAGVGYQTGLVGTTFTSSSAAAYDHLLGLTDSVGRPMDPSVAKVAALAIGATDAGLMAVGGHVVNKAVGAVGGKVSALFTREAVEAALRVPTVYAALADAAKSYGLGLTEGTGLMLAMKGADILGDAIAKQASGQPFEPTAPSEIGQQFLDAAKSSVRDFAGVAAIGPVLGFTSDAARAFQARRDVALLQATGEGVMQSKTFQRLPEAAQAFIGEAVKDGPHATVYAPVEAWTTYWQGQGEDPAKKAAELTGDSQAYPRALRSGEDLPIPFETYATKIAPIDANAFFANELRLAPDRMNGREGQAYEQQAAAEQQAEVDRAKADAVHEAATPVHEAIVAKLVASGEEPSAAEAQADLWQSAIGNLAERAQVDPLDVFNRLGLTIERPELQPDAQAGDITLSQGEPDARRAQLEERIQAAREGGHEDLQAVAELRDLQDGAPSATDADTTAAPLDARFDPASPDFLRQGERGYIRISPDRKLTIGLLKGADRSTFLHESGHAFLEVMRDLAKEPGAESIRADLATLDEHLFAGAGSETEKHERFARGFEQYLFEGKAPSVELRPVFARFRSWLLGVYRSLKGLGAELSPDVRGVFDRLVASDVAIEQAKAEGHVEPLFTDAKMAGMTPDAFDTYRATVQAASDQAKDELQVKLLRDLTREQRAWQNGERDAIRAQVESEVHQEPVYRAFAAIRKGTNPDGSPLFEGKEPEPMKLAKADLVDRYTPEDLKRLRNKQLYAADGGMPIDRAAELYGFSSGDELVKALLAAPAMKARIEGETDARLKAKLGDLLLDPGQLAEQARQAVYGEGRQQVIQAELKALTVGMAKGTIPPARVLNALAEKRIAETAVRDLRPGQFLAAARRASQRAFDLLSTHQDREGAVQAKQQELQNLANYRAALNAREEAESGVRHFGPAFDKSSTRQRIGKAGGGILEQMDAVRDRFSFANVSLKEIDRRAALDKWVSARKAMGLPTDLPPQLLDEARRTHYKNLTMEELRGVFDGLKMLEHFATLKNKLLTARDKRDYETTRDAMVQSISEHGAPHPPRLEVRPGDARTRTLGEMVAAHARLSTLIDRVDGYQAGGPVWDAIMRPINEAATAKALRYEAEGRVMREIAREAYTPSELAHLHDQTYIPAIGASLSKEARLSVALNWGNEGNRQRLLETTRRKWTAEQVQAILDTLDERDLRFVQRSLDHIGSFAPEIAAQEQRINGVKPEMVEPASWTHKEFGEQKGGYYPIAYDTRLASATGAIPDVEQADLQQHATAASLHTQQGYTKARAEQVNAPVRLELSVMHQHVDAVIHSLTHREMLIDVGRLMVDRQMRDAIESRHGDVIYKEMKGALAAVALGRSSGTTVRAVDWLRNGKTIAGLGWNVKTALLHFSGIFNGAAEIGPQWTLRAMGRVFADASTMEYSSRWVNEKSAQMRLFATNADREIADLHASLRRGGSWFDSLLRTVTADHVTRENITNSYTAMIRASIKLAAQVTWIGGYEKSMAEMDRSVPFAEREARAVALADQYVDNAHGGGQIKDLARVQRGGSVAKLFTSFYSYGAVKYNQVYRILGSTDVRRPGSVGQALVNLSLVGVAPAIYTVAVTKMLGKLRDDEGWFLPIVKEGLAEAMSAVIGLRDLAPGAEWLVDKAANPRHASEMHTYEGPAGLGLLPDLERLMQQIGQGEEDRGLMRAGAEVGGELFHQPLPQVERSIEGFMDLQTGKTTNPGALLIGPPPRKP